MPDAAKIATEAVADPRDIAAWMDAFRRAPVTVAERNGHNPKWDPPSGLTRARRWTCTECDDAVLDYDGNIYGRATERACPGKEKRS